MRRRWYVIVPALVVAPMTGGAGGASDEAQPTMPSATVRSPSSTTFTASDDPIPIDPGTDRMPSSDRSVADFTVSFPNGWTVQYGHVFLKAPDSAAEQGFYPVVVDDIFADACAGGTVGRSRSARASTTSRSAARANGSDRAWPVETTFGGRPGARIDLSVPEGFDLATCDVKDIRLRIWYSAPADKNFVLLRDAVMSVSIMDVNGKRQVFVADSRAGTSNADRREFQTVPQSIHVES
jgi:hypothetical protein